MAPFAYGVLVMLGTVLVLGVLVGAIGGAILGGLKVDLSRGAGLVIVAYLAMCALSGVRLMEWAGMLPLVTVFLLGSMTARFFRARVGLHPVLAGFAAFGIALAAGVSYLMLVRISWTFVPRNGYGVALAMLVVILITSIQRRMRASD